MESVELPPIHSHVRRIRYSEDNGDEIDLDRMRAGQEYWRESKREVATGPTEVTIFTDLTARKYTDNMDVLWRGAAAIAMTRILERAGYRVELWAVQGGRNHSDNSKRYVDGVCLKRTSDGLDESSIVQGVSAWYYRGVLLVAELGHEKELGHPVHTTNWCSEPTQDDLDKMSRDPLRIYSSGVFTFHGAVRMMEAELTRIGEQE